MPQYAFSSSDQGNLPRQDDFEINIHPLGWWLLECGHYGHASNDFYEKNQALLKCRVCEPRMVNGKDMTPLRRRVEPIDEWESEWR